MRIPLSNDQLRKVATYGAIFVAGNAIVMYHLVQKRFHQSPYFVSAAEVLLKHQPLVDYLGEPLHFGNPDLGNNVVNFSTDTEANFEVPLKGSKVKGRMRFSSVREPATENDSSFGPWRVTSLEVTVDDRPHEKVVLVR